MKKYYYFFLESVTILIIWILIIIFSISIIKENYLFIILSAIASIYFAPKSLKCILFLLDIIKGIKKKDTVFLGVLNDMNLDVFYKIKYTNIYFDDESMSKNYMVFFDVTHDEIKQGEMVTIYYYPISRIVIEITKP